MIVSYDRVDVRWIRFIYFRKTLCSTPECTPSGLMLSVILRGGIFFSKTLGHQYTMLTWSFYTYSSRVRSRYRVPCSWRTTVVIAPCFCCSFFTSRNTSIHTSVHTLPVLFALFDISSWKHIFENNYYYRNVNNFHLNY